MKVLILDDYAKPREDARKALEDILDNVEVTEFSDPREALESYRRENYDLVISDILMPDMNGFEFAAAALRHKVTPIVMHTGSWSKDYITQFVLNGASDKVPLKVVGKKYVHDNCEEYKAALKEGIEGAVEKSKKLNSGFLRTMAGLVGYNIGLKLEGLDKINAKLAEKDDYLVDYIKAVYSELINNANEAANRLDNEKLKQRILEIEWTDPGKARNTLEYMHHFRGYPLPGLSMIMNMFPEESEAFSDLESIHEKMQDITSIIMDYREMGIAIPHEKRRYKKRLANQDREPIPMADFPVKLLGRQKFHQFLWDDQWKQNLHIISPGNNPEQHEKAIEEMLDIYDSLILRSMYRGEDGSLPLAGFFDSIVIKNIENYFYAVEQIRKMDSKALAELCLHRGLQEPDAKNMFIAAEVYHETSFLGAVIEHPNLEGLYLIEFGIRSLTKS
ncbi:response regulator, partial [Candidatus Woesearchaeota archaeon]|nr:response regulator [Candidatus Woesearchaeota archaeon]